MHLGWFSPLPPARTDVAGFTARLAPALAKRVRLTLWTDSRKWDAALERCGEVRTYDRRRPPDFAAADMNIFNIGNAPFHKNIFRLTQANSGVVIVHELAIPVLLPKKRRPAERLRMIEAALGKAAGVIVHSNYALRALRPLGRPICFHPLPFQASSRKLLRNDERTGPARLIMFGFIGRNRRLENVLRALQLYPQKDKLRLDIYGELSGRWRLRILLAKLGLTRRVRLHGFVSEEKLDAALATADLAINLRYPTMGETSGSQLRIWDHAVAALVTPAGWYLDCPPGTVAYVDPKNEIAELHRHFDLFLRDPHFYRAIGVRGRETLLEQHSPEKYAETVVRFAHELLPA